MYRSAFSALFLLLGASTVAVADAFDYTLTSVGDISCTDAKTLIPDLAVLFNSEAVLVHVSGLSWEETGAGTNNSSDDAIILCWETLVGDDVLASGKHDLTEFGLQLPGELDVGMVQVNSTGSHTITVKLFGSGGAEGFEDETSRPYQSYAAAVSVIPLIVVLVLAMGTQMVEFSLFFTVRLH